MNIEDINSYFANKTYSLNVELQSLLTLEEIENLRKEGEDELNAKH